MFLLLLDICFSKVLLKQHEERSFINWMRINNAIFTGDEYNFRLGIFLTNKRLIEDFNQRHNKLFTLSLNKFACYTPSEYRSILGSIPSTNNAKISHKTDENQSQKDPDSLDWREKGGVNQIKDQGNCGSCWAFSVIAAEEGSYFASSGKLLRMSEQNLVDCVKECNGCGGGYPYKALDHVINNQNHKFALESDYPYTGHDQDCYFDSTKSVGYISSYKLYYEEKDIQPNLAKWGPVSVLIDASAFSFIFYKGGIYDGEGCEDFQNHAVSVVGYGSEDGKPYWIVRNSIGTSWGEDGYIRMLRNINICNIQGTIAVIEQ